MKKLLTITTFLNFTFSTIAQTWQPLTLPTTQDIVSSSFINDDEGWIGLENASPFITLYHTANGGNTWNPIAVNGSQNGSSYVCFLSTLKGFVVVNGKAFKTTNGGTSWTQVSLPGTPYFKPYFFNENIGYIAGTGEVYKTIDGGENWIAYPMEYEFYELWDMHFLNDSIGYASEYDGYHYSTSNGGESWEYADDDGLWDYFFAVYYHPDGYITYTGYEDFFGDFTSYIAGGGYSSQEIGELYDLKWFNGDRGYAVGQYGWVVYTDNGGLVWNELVVADLFGLNDYNLNQVDGFNDVFVFGDHGTAFKLPAYCIAAPSFSFFVSEGDVEFTDASVNASNWFWDFGDGTTSTLQNPSHTYATPGAYQVCLTTTMDGCLGDSVCTVVITCKPNESLSAAGTIDETFGENGFALINTGAFNDDFHSLLVQPDGKILAGGEEALCRFLTNGSPDATFDNDGKLTEWFGPYNDIALTADGKIVVGSRNSDDFVLAKYNTDGTVDSSFGTNGKVITDFSQTDEADFVSAILIQPDQKILMLGYYGSSLDKAILARYTADGLLDPSFSADGIVKINIPNFKPADMALQADGKILIGGESESIDFLIKRYNANGSPDLSFGNNGFATINFNSAYGLLIKVLIQDDGKIVAAGSSDGDFILVRFDSQGMLDLTFGNNGVTMKSYDGDSEPRAAVLQPDGKILMTGYLYKGPEYDEIVVLRFSSDGKLDSAFGNYGAVNTLVNCDDSQSDCIAVDGNYIYVGGGRHTVYGESCLIRYVNGCVAPQGLEVMSLSPTMAALNWDDAAGADSYNLRYKVSGTNSWQNKSSAISEKKLKQLLPATKYTVQVRSQCSNPESVSDWSEKLKFTTPLQKLAGELLPSATLQVYPNPFSDQATLEFSTYQNCTLEIALLDLQGREFKTIAKGNFSEGNHHLILEKENLNAGIYLLQLRTDSGITTQKLIVQ